MDKTAIRNFAIWARNKLISDVAYRAGLMGITADGIADKLPQSTNNVQFYDIGTSEPYQITGKEIAQRSNLVFLIKRRAKSSDYATAYTSIIEEVAYTWFNRLIAIRFMEVNDYLPSHVRVLSSESGKIEPDIVTNPFDADLGLTEMESSKILEFKQDNDSDELFKLLFIKQCNKLSDILPRLFEKTDDYTELLFNCSYVDQEGIVYRLTHDIPEENFDINRGGQVEIIGWLYQYYNAELKDDTFALLKKNVKITKERIPSATQLFTPDWIVRYMVENSLGRLWTEGHTNTASRLRGNWKYYLDEAEQKPDVQQKLSEIRKECSELHPEDIKLIDPCMGSGHILVYAFDVLMEIYESEGYSQRDATVQILENNIWGLDIDDRAAQLAYFAVMMKARQYNRRILDGMHDCHVLAIQESNGMSTLQTYMAPFGELSDAALRLINAYIDAKEYGSILSVPLTLEEIDALQIRLEGIKNNRSSDVEELTVEAMLLNEIPPMLNQARIMIQKYDVVVTNPPYMGSGGMSPKLVELVREMYVDSSGDLSTVMMERSFKLAKKNGYIAMINIPVWMFITTYERLRNKMLADISYQSMIHAGRGIFGSDFGTTTFVIRNNFIDGYQATYYRLFDKQVEVKSVDQRERDFLAGKGLFVSSQTKYRDIPGSPVAYWVSDEFVNAFRCGRLLGDCIAVKKGMDTGNNDYFLRLWYEVNKQELSLNGEGKKWIPYDKGGDYRKWFGNNSYVLNWGNDGYELKHSKANLRSKQLYFKESITWNALSVSDTCFRLSPFKGSFDSAGSSMFPSSETVPYYLGFLNSVVSQNYLNVINPTINYGAGTIATIPVLSGIFSNDSVTELVKECIRLSEDDWDSYELSWGFKNHPLI